MEPRCTCTHAAALHGYGRRDGRTVRVACSASTCACRQYEPGAPDDHCPTCGSRWSPTEVARNQARPCLICGAPVPAGQAKCATDCKPRVIPAPGEDGTDG